MKTSDSLIRHRLPKPSRLNLLSWQDTSSIAPISETMRGNVLRSFFAAMCPIIRRLPMACVRTRRKLFANLPRRSVIGREPRARSRTHLSPPQAGADGGRMARRNEAGGNAACRRLRSEHDTGKGQPEPARRGRPSRPDSWRRVPGSRTDRANFAGYPRCECAAPRNFIVGKYAEGGPK